MPIGRKIGKFKGAFSGLRCGCLVWIPWVIVKWRDAARYGGIMHPWRLTTAITDNDGLLSGRPAQVRDPKCAITVGIPGLVRMAYCIVSVGIGQLA